HDQPIGGQRLLEPADGLAPAERGGALASPVGGRRRRHGQDQRTAVRALRAGRRACIARAHRLIHAAAAVCGGDGGTGRSRPILVGMVTCRPTRGWRRHRLLAAVALSLYALLLAVSPVLHHDLACHVKSPTHCDACVANSPASRVEATTVAIVPD